MCSLEECLLQLPKNWLEFDKDSDKWGSSGLQTDQGDSEEKEVKVCHQFKGSDNLAIA